MLHFHGRGGTRNCEGISRRSFLSVGSLPLLGLSLPSVLRASQSGGNGPVAKNCIMLFLEGGISTIDTFDMKPDAPPEYRGEFKSIGSNVPGQTVCEHLPKVAQVMDKVCQLRTVVHDLGQHAAARHKMLTGWDQINDPDGKPVGSTVHPCLGSVVAEQKGWRAGMPPFVELVKGFDYHHAGYLGSAYDPLAVHDNPSKDDFRVKNISLGGKNARKQLDRRREMLKAVDDLQHLQDRSAGAIYERNRFYQQAYELVTSKAAKEAFRIDKEAEKLRDRYGRHQEGQSALLARRLVEAGVRFVTVSLDGYDTHNKNFIELRRDLLPKLNQTYSALLEDLDQRGMLEETLVLCMGEFGRTPKVNGAAGRDHYPKVNNINLTGAGVRMGEVIGQTDDRCSSVISEQHTPHDLMATVYHLLGVDYTKEYRTADGRPILTTDHGQPIRSVLS